MERNTEHLLAIAEQIRNEPETLDMEDWRAVRGFNETGVDGSGFPCGSASCIGGWSQALRGVSPLDEHPIATLAAMGLTEDEGYDLCYGLGVSLFYLLPVDDRGERFADILTAIAHGADVRETLGTAWFAAFHAASAVTSV